MGGEDLGGHEWGKTIIKKKNYCMNKSVFYKKIKEKNFKGSKIWRDTSPLDHVALAGLSFSLIPSALLKKKLDYIPFGYFLLLRLTTKV